MADGRTAKDLMIDVFEYPHMPYWFTIRQAIGIMNKTVIDAQKCINPQVILVFDEKYNLIGTLTIRDILRGLIPGLSVQQAADANTASAEAEALARIEANLTGADMKPLLEKPISELMNPVRVSVSLEESIARAAFLMERGNLEVLPVLENNKKLVGIVRTMEIFREVSNIVKAK